MKRLINLFLVMVFVAFGSFAWAADGDPVLQGGTNLEVGADDSTGTIDLHSAGTLTFNDDSDDTTVVVGPVADGSTTLGITGSLSLSGGLTALGDLVLGADDDIANVVIHDAGTITMYDDSDDTSVVIGPVGNGTTTLGITGSLDLSGGITLGTALAIAEGGTGATTAQAAIDALTAVSGATNEHVLTKDTATGNAVWKASAAGGDPSWGSIGAATVSGGEIATGGNLFFAVTGEGDSADTITQLDGAAVGDIVVLKGKVGLGYNLTFTDGANLDLQSNFIMDSANDTLTIMCVATDTPDAFVEISRASNG